MAATISAVWPPSTACWSCICSSRSVDRAAGIGEFLRMPRFIHKDFERGKVCVPFDQRGHRTKASERRCIEFPDVLGNSGPVVVNQDIDVFGGVMTSKMDLANRLDRQGI